MESEQVMLVPLNRKQAAQVSLCISLAALDQIVPVDEAHIIICAIQSAFPS